MSDWGAPTDQQILTQLAARGVASPLVSYVQLLRQLSTQFGVPLAIILAHLGVESGYGTDPGKLHDANNFLGLTGKGDAGSVYITDSAGHVRQFAAFSSIETGLRAGIANMASQGYRGLTLRQYLARYLTGDPNGTTDGAGGYVTNYVAAALRIAHLFGGTATADTVVIAGGGATSSPNPSPAPGPAPVPNPDAGSGPSLPGLAGLLGVDPATVSHAAISGVVLVVGVALILIGATGIVRQSEAGQAAIGAATNAAKAAVLV